MTNTKVWLLNELSERMVIWKKIRAYKKSDQAHCYATAESEPKDIYRKCLSQAWSSRPSSHAFFGQVYVVLDKYYTAWIKRNYEENASTIAGEKTSAS